MTATTSTNKPGGWVTEKWPPLHPGTLTAIKLVDFILGEAHPSTNASDLFAPEALPEAAIAMESGEYDYLRMFSVRAFKHAPFGQVRIQLLRAPNINFITCYFTLRCVPGQGWRICQITKGPRPLP